MKGKKMSDKEWQAEKRKINKRLLARMEQPTNIIDLAYFSEAMMWYDPIYLEQLGLKVMTIHNTEFQITPKNSHVYLYLGSTLYKQDTLNVKTKTT